MICPKCGAEQPENSRFCVNCGARLDGDVATGAVSGAGSSPNVPTPGGEVSGNANGPANPTDVPTPATTSPEPTSSPKSMKWTRRNLIIAGVTAAVIVAAVGGIGTYMWLRSSHANAATDCAAAVAALDKAETQSEKSIDAAKALSSTDAKDVADAGTIDTLSKALDRMSTASKTTYACPSDAATNDLKATADAARTTLGKRNAAVKAVVKAADAVATSKAEKTFDAAKSELQAKIDEAKKILDSSSGKVKDEGTRTALKAAIDAANKTVGSATPKQAKAVTDAVDTVSKAMDAVNKSVAAKTAEEIASGCTPFAGNYVDDKAEQAVIGANCDVTVTDTGGNVWGGFYENNGSFKANSDGTRTWTTFSPQNGDMHWTWNPSAGTLKDDYGSTYSK